MMDKVQKPRNSECHAPSLEPFRVQHFSLKVIRFLRKYFVMEGQTFPSDMGMNCSEYLSEVQCSICKYCHVYRGWVVWLITLRGFGLDTGFIHYGDYNYTDYNYWLLTQQHTTKYRLSDLTPLITETLLNTGFRLLQFTASTVLFWIWRLTDEDSLTHWRRLTQSESKDWLTPKTDRRKLRLTLLSVAFFI
jgi:hypothetical protein